MSRRLAPAFVAFVSAIVASAALAGVALPGAPAFAAPAQEPAVEGDYLWRTVMLRAGPGSLATVIDRITGRLDVWGATAPAGPFVIRHSQGDHWDLLLLFAEGSFAEYHAADASASRRQAAVASGQREAEFEAGLLPHVAWREELWVSGPSPEVLAQRFDDSGFFHFEIFLALPGKRGELLEQRRMENVYLEEIGREPNLIFTRVAGAPWDLYTLGTYRDLPHFAESAGIPADVEERAALEAGFEGVDTIGTYLRELIARHQDTLAYAVR